LSPSAHISFTRVSTRSHRLSFRCVPGASPPFVERSGATTPLAERPSVSPPFAACPVQLLYPAQS
jgi:hypothetical protein